MSSFGLESKGSPQFPHKHHRASVKHGRASSMMKSDRQSCGNHGLPDVHATIPKNTHLSKFVSATLRSIQYQASAGRPETERTMHPRSGSGESGGSHGVASAEASGFECATIVDSEASVRRNSAGDVGTPFVLRSFSRFLPFYQLAIKEIIAECERKVAINGCSYCTNPGGGAGPSYSQQNYLHGHTAEGSVDGSVSPSVSTRVFDGPPPEYAFFEDAELDEDGDAESVAPSSSLFPGCGLLDAQATRLDAGSMLSVDSCTPSGTMLWPKESMELFLTELGKQVSCKETAPLVFTAALVFLSRIARRAFTDQEGITTQNWFRLTTVSILIAFKMFSEGPGLSRANRFFSSSSNIPLEELNRLEIDFLYLIDFDLFLEERDVMCWVMWMERLAHKAGMVTPLQSFMLMAPPSRAASTIGYSASTLPDVGEGGNAAYYSYSHSGVGVIRSPTSFFSAHQAGGMIDAGMGYPTSSTVCGGGSELGSQPMSGMGMDFWDENQRHLDGLTRSGLTFHSGSNSGANFLERHAHSPVNEVTAGSTHDRLFSAVHLAPALDTSPSSSSLKYMSLQGDTPSSPPLPPTASPLCLGPLQKRRQELEDALPEMEPLRLSNTLAPPPAPKRFADPPAPSMQTPSFLEGRPRGRRNKAKAKEEFAVSRTVATTAAAPQKTALPPPPLHAQSEESVNRRAVRVPTATASLMELHRNRKGAALEHASSPTNVTGVKPHPAAELSHKYKQAHDRLTGVAKKVSSSGSTAGGGSGGGGTSATGPIRQLVGRFREVVRFTSALARGRLDVLSPQGVRRSGDGDVGEDDEEDEEDVPLSGSIDTAPSTPQEDTHHHRHSGTSASLSPASGSGSGVQMYDDEELLSASSSIDKGSGSFPRRSQLHCAGGPLKKLAEEDHNDQVTPPPEEVPSAEVEESRGWRTLAPVVRLDDAPAGFFNTCEYHCDEEVGHRRTRQIPAKQVDNDTIVPGSQQEETFPFFESHHLEQSQDSREFGLPRHHRHYDPEQYTTSGIAAHMDYHVNSHAPYNEDYEQEDYYDDDDDFDTSPPYMRAPPRIHSPPCID